MSKEGNFVNEFMTRLDGKVSPEEMNTIIEELSMFITDWHVEKKSTEIALYNFIPESYKVYMVAKKISGRSNGTLDLYRMVLEPMFNTIKKPIEKITTNDLRLYLYQLQLQRGLSDRTLDQRRLIINSYFEWCAEEGYLLRNPCASIDPIKYEETPRKPYTDVEMELLRSACRTLRERAIIELLYATGCRISELANMKKEDIDFKTREVTIFGKGKKYRTSYINARAEVALKMYLKSRKDDSPYVIVPSKKTRDCMNSGGIRVVVKKIGARAGVENAIPHRVRHTFATDALNRGMAPTELMSLMGHEKMDTTLVYAKINKLSIQTSHQKYVV